jgi:hypothetical protein
MVVESSAHAHVAGMNVCVEYRAIMRVSMGMRVAVLVLLSACAETIPSSRSTAPPQLVVIGTVQGQAPPTLASPAKEGCAAGFVEIQEETRTVRLEAGRELIPGRRGATYPYVEHIVHRSGLSVWLVAAVGEATVSLKLVDAVRSEQPINMNAEVSFTTRGAAEREEWRANGVAVVLSQVGHAGSFVDGSFGPVKLCHLGRGGDQACMLARGSFHVCRTQDWHVVNP